MKRLRVGSERRGRVRLRVVGMVAAASLLVLLAGCFEPPVTETVELIFHPGDTYTIRVGVKVSEPAYTSSDSALHERLERARRAVLEGRDDWSRRFESVRPEAERFYWEKREGDLVRAVRSAQLQDDRELTRFFADTPLLVGLRRTEDWQELTIHASAPTRATRDEYRRVKAVLGGWSERLEDYYAALHDLYGYLERRPERADACLGTIFSDLLNEAQQDALDEPSAEEEELLQPLQEAMEAVFEVLEISSEEAYSLDELSHRVFDPFPGRMSVQVDGEVLEVEGLRRIGESAFVVPGLGLWASLRKASGRWAEPDPLLALVDQARYRPDEPFDLAAFSARTRRLPRPPAAREVEAAILEGLAPEPAYRVRWRGVAGDGAAPGWD